MLCFHCKDQPVSAVWGNIKSLLWEGNKSRNTLCGSNAVLCNVIASSIHRTLATVL
jgi:hypothetical protein